MEEQRKIFNYESKILVKETIDKFGYDPDTLGKSSGFFVIATCRVCGKPHEIRKGFFMKAGSACHKACKNEELKKQKSPFSDPEIRAKSKAKIKEKYGTEFASQNKDIAKKISDTRSSEENKNMIKETCLERYGVENPFQAETIKNKIKGVMVERYGYDHAMKNPLLKKKGAEKFKENFATNPENENSIILILRGNRMWEMLKQGNSLTEACNVLGIDIKDTTTIISREEFKDRYISTYTFPKTQKQKEIKDILEKNGIKCEFNTRKIIPPFELDIYIPDKNFAIEFNGNLWHSEFMLKDKAKMKHLTKTRMCQNKGITLFHIFEHQWDERKSQVLNLIKSKLGIVETKLMARNCNITNDECKDFIEENHIQGYGVGTIKYFNLEINGKIVASMTASKHHRQIKDDDCVVLNRLCFKDGVSVAGGASKLFKAFVEWSKEQGYKKIISWSDNCWTEGKIYGILGFILEQEYPPDYFYYDIKKHKVFSKQSQMKSNNDCPKEKTEKEWCEEHDLYRIWDCGKKRWIINL